MTHEEKINYMRIATGICHFGFNEQQLDLLVSIYDLVMEHKGQTSLHHIVDAECDVKKRAEERVKAELLAKKEPTS